MSDKVSEWLKGLGLGQYSTMFQENAIDWELLPDLDLQTLKDIGVDAAGHRLRILKAISTPGPEQSTIISQNDKKSTTETVPPSLAEEDITAWSRTPG
jgi:hypothetical protein